jgi:hypothetical protein
MLRYSDSVKAELDSSVSVVTKLQAERQKNRIPTGISRDSSVSIVTRQQAEGPRNRGSIPGRGQPNFRWLLGGSFPGNKRSEREARHQFPSALRLIMCDFVSTLYLYRV